MFMQTCAGENPVENVCWFMSPDGCCKPRFKSPWAAKVRCDTWAAKSGCCKSIGPPPKIAVNCPDQFLRKHSRQVPVFIPPEILRMRIQKPPGFYEAERCSKDVLRARRKLKKQRHEEKTCNVLRPLSRTGLFRGPQEPSYEERIRRHKEAMCQCDKSFLRDVMNEGENCVCVEDDDWDTNEELSLTSIKQENEDGNCDGYGHREAQVHTKDHIRANALRVIRMPPRRLRRCYLDNCGVHLMDMSDAPYVLRPGFGKVPQYLIKRKLELYMKDLEAKRRMQITPDLNDLQQVDDPERISVIRGLMEYWQDLQAEYNALPLESSTGKPTQKQRDLKAGLECKLKEVEQDLRLLNGHRFLYVGDVSQSQYL